MQNLSKDSPLHGISRRGGYIVLRKELVSLALATAAGFAGGSLTNGLTTVFAQGLPKPNIVQARSFVVIDTRGATRAELGVDYNGNTIFNLYDQHGHKVFSIPANGITPAGPRNQPVVTEPLSLRNDRQ
jgi:hypothetical protein